jgi:glycosyltransferase involved in cell wall biosynthesis
LRIQISGVISLERNSDDFHMDITATIGLCVKNSEVTVRETVESIIHQDFPHEAMEIIVVDGESVDKTVPVIRDSLMASDIQVEFYYDQGKGLGAARQIVVDKACGEYILWVDGDNVLSENYVRKQVEFMIQNPRVGAAQGSWGLYKTDSFIATLANLSELENKCLDKNITAMGTVKGIYRLRAIKQAGGFDKCIKGASEDLDLSYRIWRSGWLLSESQAIVYQKWRTTWKDLWKWYSWWGYGEHYRKHKFQNLVILWKEVPILRALFSGLRQGYIAYKETHLKISFLLPLLFFYRASAWWSGFLNSHRDKYGHKMST